MSESMSWQDNGNWIECTCGNAVHTGGFYPADPATGAELEPYVGGGWDERTYVCGGCGVVGVPATPAEATA